MQYISTRGRAPALDFEGVLLEGLASDGGLYVPKRWPRFTSAEIRDMRGLSYEDLAVKIMMPFMGDDFISYNAFRKIVRESYKSFPPEVTPLKNLFGSTYVLDLSQGPTLAFKDVALQNVVRLFSYALQRNDSFMNVALATSGDTGASGAHACKGLPNINIFVLYPNGRISNIQRPFMTTIPDDNVYILAVEGGTFDDCQSMVKAFFNDLAFRGAYRLGAMNSINWARVMAQTVYYFYSAVQLGAPDKKIKFVVPTGNFGNIFAGNVAIEMGLPIDKLAIATNSNDILHSFMQTGKMATSTVKQTYSPSMDIQKSSNFERLLFDALGRNPKDLTRYMNLLDEKGCFRVSSETRQRIQGRFLSGSADNTDTGLMIGEVYKKYNYLIDPHTAVGLHVEKSLRKDGAIKKNDTVVCLSTANPAKFPDVVKRYTGVYPELPPHLADLPTRPEREYVMPNNMATVKSFIAAHALTA